MLYFSNSKINLGLWILRKREDGYHDIATIFYPIDWSDILEVILVNDNQRDIRIFNYGLPLHITLKDNIIYKAHQLMLQKGYINYIQDSIEVYLYKNVPFGAGLGAGSANAAYYIKMINTLYELNLSVEDMKNLASLLGADCAFFIENRPALASGKGDILKPISINLSSYYLLVVYPDIFISTSEAYQNVRPVMRKDKLEEIIQLPIKNWKEYLCNDFEQYIFMKYPLIKQIKEQMYQDGAIYSSMSGSGSAVFGLFEKEPPLAHYSFSKIYLKKPDVL